MAEENKVNTTEFLEAKSKRDLASFLGIQYSQLMYLLHFRTDEQKYKEFKIQKRSGGTRLIFAPKNRLKFIQRKLNEVLQEIYKQKTSVHGFVRNKSIKSNAKNHINKRFLINIDIKDFFPSINFGRVYGVFSSYPFNFNKEVAVALAQICCHKAQLPTGAPTSPIVSNFVCRRLDNALMTFLSKQKCSYTRYADDITISTNLKLLPSTICSITENTLTLNRDFIQIFETNGFQINPDKTRYATKQNRQEVTGLIVNKKVNINRKYLRQVRAMINAWETHGIQKAALEHFQKYNFKNRVSSDPEFFYKNTLIGRVGFIGYIKGIDNPTYISLFRRLKTIEPEIRLKYIQNEIELSQMPVIFGEGKTDGIYLKKALAKFKTAGKFKNLNVNIHEYSNEIQINNTQLLQICKSLAKTSISKNLVICLFDRDDDEINKDVIENGLNFKHWGNNVYSLLIPVPSHRDFNKICIEHYLLDNELTTLDKAGRRLFLSTEFNKETGNHNHEKLYCEPVGRLKVNYPKILDNNIYTYDKINVALSKNNFANYIYNDSFGFENFTFYHFKEIFDALSEIISASRQSLLGQIVN